MFVGRRVAEAGQVDAGAEHAPVMGRPRRGGGAVAGMGSLARAGAVDARLELGHMGEIGRAPRGPGAERLQHGGPASGALGEDADRIAEVAVEPGAGADAAHGDEGIAHGAEHILVLDAQFAARRSYAGGGAQIGQPSQWRQMRS